MRKIVQTTSKTAEAKRQAYQEAEKADARKEAHKLLMQEYYRKVKTVKNSQVTVESKVQKSWRDSWNVEEDIKSFHHNRLNKIQVKRE